LWHQGRAEAKKIYAFLALSAEKIEARVLKGEKPHGPLAMTLTARLVEKGKYSWHVPVVNKCTTHFIVAGEQEDHCLDHQVHYGERRRCRESLGNSETSRPNLIYSVGTLVVALKLVSGTIGLDALYARANHLES
jgi:hypothetical protein